MPSVVIDGRALRIYPLGQAGFHGGTESYVRRLAAGLAERGYLVHVLTPDLEREEQRGEREFWWPESYGPTRTDYWVAVHSTEYVPNNIAQHFILAPNGIDPPMNEEDGQRVAAVACFSACHVDLLTQARPSISRDICKVTGLGVDLDEYDHFVGVRRKPGVDPEKKRKSYALSEVDEIYELNGAKPHTGRFLYANDPARGLHHTLAIFDELRREIPDAELRIAYDFDRQFENYRWQASALAERMWECKERIEQGDGVVNLGGLDHAALVAEQLACDLHIYPSDPPNHGSQIHGLTQLELAAAGVPLVLSDIEAFPELFGSCATLLPLPGTMARDGDELARITPADWAKVTLELMSDRDKWQAAAEAGRALAAEHTWDHVIDRWDELLKGLPLD